MRRTWWWGRWRRSSRLGLLLLSRRAETGPDLIRHLVLDGARVRSLIGDPDLQKIVQNRFALDFELAR
jgi:hypothetical protein